MLAAIFRFLIVRLIVHPSTYLGGMVLVRLSRRFKSGKRGREFRTISNFAGKLKMRVDVNSYMGGSLYWTGYHHINEFLFLRSHLNEDMTFVDVGANQGEFTIFASSRLKSGRVLSFEPVKANLEQLRQNLTLNGCSNVEVNDVGLFKESGEYVIYTPIDEKTNNEGLSSLYVEHSGRVVEEKIRLEKFDDLYFDRLDRLDVLKIDVEGAELYALQGMERSIGKFRPVILIEVNRQGFEAAGYNTGNVTDFLERYGYKAYQLFRGKLVAKVGAITEDWGNYVFISAESSSALNI